MKRKIMISAAGIAAAFLFVISGVSRVNAKGTSLEIPLYHHHSESCVGDVIVLKEADGNKILETVSESSCTLCGGIVHDYRFVAECSCGYHIEREGWACYHSMYGDDPTGCPTYREVDFDTEHEHPERARVCGLNETDCVGTIGIEISDTLPARTITIKADYNGSLPEPEFQWEDSEKKMIPGSSISVEKNGIYTLLSTYSEDGNNYHVSKEIQINNIDTDGPVITDIKKGQTDPTNKPVTVTVNAEDKMAGLAENPYSIDGTGFQAGNTFEIAKNGIYQIAVSDCLGNVSREEIEIANIDTEYPSLEINLTPKKWTEGDCTITAIASDEGLGLGEMPYSFDGGKTWGNENHISVSRSRRLEILVRDAAGNVTSKTVKAVLKEKKQEEKQEQEEKQNREEKQEQENIEKESESVKKENPEKESKKESEKNTGKENETEKTGDDLNIENNSGADVGTEENKQQIGDVIPENTLVYTVITKKDETDSGKQTISAKGEKKDNKDPKAKTEKREENSAVENNPEETGEGETGQIEPETAELNIPDVQDEFTEILPEEKADETTNVVQTEKQKTWKNTKVGIILEKIHVKLMKLPKEYRILGITSSTLTGFTGTFFGIFFLTRSAGVFWLDGKGKEHFLARNLIHRKGEMYTMKINRSALINSESKNLRIRMPGVFVALHRYRPFIISMGNTTVSQNVEKTISVHLP